MKKINSAGCAHTAFLLVAIAFAVTAGCANSSGSSDTGEPTEVDITAPSVASLEAFDGEFSDSRTTATALVQDAMKLMGTLTRKIFDYPSATTRSDEAPFRSTASVTNGPHILEAATDVITGTSVTGWMISTHTASVIDDANPGTNAGDQETVNFTDKLSIDFTDYEHNGMTIRGKHGIADSIYSDYRVTNFALIGDTEYTYSSKKTIVTDTVGETGLSLARDGTGVKAIIRQTMHGTMTTENRFTGPINPKDGDGDEEFGGDLEMQYDDGFEVTIEIYDNADQLRFSEKFTTYSEWATYFGV